MFLHPLLLFISSKYSNRHCDVICEEEHSKHLLWCVSAQEEMQRRETVILSFLLTEFICLRDESSSVFICVCAKEWIFKKYLFGVVGGNA